MTSGVTGNRGARKGEADITDTVTPLSVERCTTAWQGLQCSRFVVDSPHAQKRKQCSMCRAKFIEMALIVRKAGKARR